MNLKFWKKKPKEIPIEDASLQGITQKDFQRMIKLGKPSNTIGGFTSKAFIELPFGMIKREIPELLKSDQPAETIILIMKHQFGDFTLGSASGNEIVSFLIWIKLNMERLQLAEKNNLSSEPEPELLAAGVMKLDEFGIDPTLEKIAKDWNYTPEQVAEFPYHKIYRKMKLDKVNRDIEKKYNKIMEDKSKRK